MPEVTVPKGGRNRSFRESKSFMVRSLTSPQEQRGSGAAGKGAHSLPFALGHDSRQKQVLGPVLVPESAGEKQGTVLGRGRFSERGTGTTGRGTGTQGEGIGPRGRGTETQREGTGTQEEGGRDPEGGGDGARGGKWMVLRQTQKQNQVQMKTYMKVCLWRAKGFGGGFRTGPAEEAPEGR